MRWFCGEVVVATSLNFLRALVSCDLSLFHFFFFFFPFQFWLFVFLMVIRLVDPLQSLVLRSSFFLFLTHFLLPYRARSVWSDDSAFVTNHVPPLFLSLPYKVMVNFSHEDDGEKEDEDQNERRGHQSSKVSS